MAVEDTGKPVGEHLFDDQRVADPVGAFPLPDPHPGEACHGLWHLRARRDEAHICRQRRLPVALPGHHCLGPQPEDHREA